MSGAYLYISKYAGISGELAFTQINLKICLLKERCERQLASATTDDEFPVKLHTSNLEAAALHVVS
jgi:hypothetical protein